MVLGRMGNYAADPKVAECAPKGVDACLKAP